MAFLEKTVNFKRKFFSFMNNPRKYVHGGELERPLDVEAGLRGHLEEPRRAARPRVVFCLLFGNLSRPGQVDLGAGHEDGNPPGTGVNHREPLVVVVERRGNRHVKQEDRPLCPVAVTREQDTEPFLAPEIPDLEQHGGLAYDDPLRVEISSNRQLGVFREEAHKEPVSQRGLPYRPVPDEENFAPSIPPITGGPSSPRGTP